MLENKFCTATNIVFFTLVGSFLMLYVLSAIAVDHSFHFLFELMHMTLLMSLILIVPVVFCEVLDRIIQLLIMKKKIKQIYQLASISNIPNTTILKNELLFTHELKEKEIHS